MRNRIIAALADVVVVVEAATTGGALHTARWALDYGRPLLVPPGSRRNPVAAGTNQLLREGAHPLLEPTDVLEALALTAGSRRGAGIVEPARPGPPHSRPARALPAGAAGTASTPRGLAGRLLVAARSTSARVVGARRPSCGPAAASRRRSTSWRCAPGWGSGRWRSAVAELEAVGRLERRRGWWWPC